MNLMLKPTGTALERMYSVLPPSQRPNLLLRG